MGSRVASRRKLPLLSRRPAADPVAWHSLARVTTGHLLSGSISISCRHIGLRSLPGVCQIGYMCDQNSTYGLHSPPGGVQRLVTWTIPAVIS